MRDYFHRLADALVARIHPGEVLLASFGGEASDFVRFNGSRVRQAGNVQQRRLAVDLIEGDRHAGAGTDLTGDPEVDLAMLADTLDRLRAMRARLEPDPYLLYQTDPHDSEDVRAGTLPDSGEALARVATAAPDLDLVGVWASGSVMAGFASSLGQRNWYESASFHFDWSCHSKAGNAVKCSHAGFEWDGAEIDRKLERARGDLAVLDRPVRELVPGRYRAYLAPTAMAELLGLLAWDGFDLKSHRTRQTPLARMITGERRMSPIVQLSESPATGLAPRFTSSGFTKADRVELIRGGVLGDCLVAPRAGREYGVPVNAGHGFPESLELAPGTLDRDVVARELGTGLHLSNLWYANFSDRNDCRITGMTRYACLWVQDGEVVAPIAPMRFDDSLYDLLGDQLVALTRERELIVDSGTYGGRSLASARLPGALVGEIALTL